MIGSIDMKTGTAQRLGLARLMLLLFCLRSLLPIGFMPDFGLLKQGDFQIVLCTPLGSTAVTLDAEGLPVDGDTDPADASFGQDCPFGTTFGKALDLPLAAALPAASSVTEAAPSSNALALRPPPQGPPLGARAPPTLLG